MSTANPIFDTAILEPRLPHAWVLYHLLCLCTAVAVLIPSLCLDVKKKWGFEGFLLRKIEWEISRMERGAWC